LPAMKPTPVTGSKINAVLDELIKREPTIRSD
jgi:hypothetical protein